MLPLNIEEISQAEFKFMGAVVVLNTEVKSPGQTVILSSQGQSSLKISIGKRTIKHLLFSKFGWIVVGFFSQYSITEKYILIGPVGILWIHTEGRPSAALICSKSEKT